ncbi:MAG: arginine repressor [Oscillospiraceae bacterium]|jgi:transcriptional regulator of arginine metabolism|nr:arginine repressor [Oscillospiraceae bacterium]
MKRERQEKILEIVGRAKAETQEELLGLLRAEGIEATQATVSRDIRELRLVKTLTERGSYRYALPGEASDDAMTARLRGIFRECVTSIDAALNLVVIKTLPGMAQAACAALDASPNPSVVGTLAGDDTAFIALRSERGAKTLAEQLWTIVEEVE